MNKTVCLIFLGFFTACVYAASMDWRNGRPGINLVTNEEDRVSMSAMESQQRRMGLVPNVTKWVDWTGGVWRVEQQVVPGVLFYDFSTNAVLWGHAAASALIPTDNQFHEAGLVLVKTDGISGDNLRDPFYPSHNLYGTWPIMLDGASPFPMTNTFNSPHTGTVIISQVFRSVTSCWDRVALRSDALTLNRFHADSYTNLIWVEVFSNGWPHYEAYTNSLDFLVP